MTFQKAVLTYIASQDLTKEEEKNFQEAFLALDLNDDGRISNYELASSYRQMCFTEKEADIEATNTIRKIDINQNGDIDYNEFIMANLRKGNGLSEEKLKKAFKFFDTV